MEDLKYTEILKINREMDGKLSGLPYKISILSNVTINTLKEILEYNCRINEIEPIIEIGNFDNIVQDSSNIGHQDMVIIIYDMLSIIDGLGVLFEDITDQAYQNLFLKLCSEIDLIFNHLKHIPAVVFNTFSSSYFVQNYVASTKLDIFVAEINSYLLQKKALNGIFLTIDKIFTKIGIDQCIDYRFYNSSKAPYTLAFNKEYVLALQSIILQNNGRLKKAIIFDCDNTLWKGIIGEDGINGIDMNAKSSYGKFFNIVQHIAVYLAKNGVIVGLCSKNNSNDVEEVLKHGDMVLNNDSLVIKKINWTDKASNLRTIASELNIGIESLVFVDDSPFEINFIKEQLPQILTLQVPANISEYPSKLLKIIYKNFYLGKSKEDFSKTLMYKEQVTREASKTAYSSIDEYLSSLEIEVTVTKDISSDIPRLAQLTQKTNQFNLTTKRYTENEIQGFIESRYESIFSIFVKDKYGDSGLTGMAIIVRDNNDIHIANIDSLLISCRIIGRNIEYVFLNYLITKLKAGGYQTVQASYIPTKKNVQVKHFFKSFGFESTSIDADGTNHYKLDIIKFHPKSKDYINLIEK